jgi:hypothetical protein
LRRKPNTAGKAAWICLGIAWLAFPVARPGPRLRRLGAEFRPPSSSADRRHGEARGDGRVCSSCLSSAGSPFVVPDRLHLFFGSVGGNAPSWAEWTREHGTFQSSVGGDAAEEANQAASQPDIAAIEAMADAAIRCLRAAQASVVAARAATSTR